MIDLEVVRWKLRGSAGVFHHGDSYEIFGYLEKLSKDVAVFTGFIGRVFPGMRQEIVEAIIHLGFKRVVWENGNGNYFEQDLTQWKERAMTHKIELGQCKITGDVQGGSPTFHTEYHGITYHNVGPAKKAMVLDWAHTLHARILAHGNQNTSHGDFEATLGAVRVDGKEVVSATKLTNLSYHAQQRAQEIVMAGLSDLMWAGKTARP